MMKNILILALAFTAACATNAETDDDASVPHDASSDSSSHDAAIQDGASTDSSADSGIDAATPDDASNDAPDDALDDAPEIIDAPPDGPVNLCTGVDCTDAGKGYACCKVTTNKNYGKCEDTSCVTTCCQ